MLTVYVYDRCSTCRAALKWLDQRGIAHRALPIRERPPTPAELRRMLPLVGGEVKALFNRSGTDYRALGMATRLKDLDVGQAIALLAANGNLVKRPFALAGAKGTVGFEPERWARLFG